MKKIFIFILTTSLLFSCSNNEDLNENNSKANNSAFKTKDNTELKKAYKNMINSQSYITYQTMLVSFVEKMKYTGISSDLYQDGYALNWISGNITKTDFVDYPEAVSNFEDITSQMSLVYKEHELFFSLAQLATQQEFLDAVSSNSSAVSCIECYDSNDSCKKGANAMLEVNISAAGGQIGNQISQLAYAYVGYTADILSCNGALRMCLKRCMED